MECYAREIVNSFGSNPCTFTYELEYPVDMTHDNWYVALNGYSKNFDIKFKGEEQGALLTANFLVRGGFGTSCADKTRIRHHNGVRVVDELTIHLGGDEHLILCNTQGQRVIFIGPNNSIKRGGCCHNTCGGNTFKLGHNLPPNHHDGS